MFLALRELRFNWVRFGLMGAVIALITVLMVMLSGLSVGLVRHGVSGLQNLPVTAMAFEEGVQHDSAYSRSVVEASAVDEWRAQPGVEDAAPYGNALVNGRTDTGVQVDLATFGIDPDSFLAPEIGEGHGLTAGPAGAGEVVVSRMLLDEGVVVGDVITLERIGTRLTVVGTTTGQDTFGHVNVGYVQLPTWQRIRAGVGEGEPMPGRSEHEITAVAVKSADGAELDLAAGDAAAGTESLTLEESFGASPGYSAETMTLSMIQGFLYAISALVAGAFFAVWAIQRRQEVAVLRALGASPGWVLRDALVQAALLLAAAVAVGAAIGVALGAVMTGSGVPFALSAPDVSLAALGLILLGLVGAGVAVARLSAIDPATALGGNR